MSLHSLAENILHPPVLFFFLGILAVLFKSDLSIPDQIGKFLSLYLLFDIGIKGGEELFHSGLNFTVFKVMTLCLLASFFIPFIVYLVLRRKLDVYNSVAISAAYGSISAVTFATTVSFLESSKIKFGGHMVAGMALMESPAIIAGLIILGLATQKKGKENEEKAKKKMTSVLHHAIFNGSVFLLIGSLFIGYLGGSAGEEELRPFVDGIFKGMLSFYMLDMGLVAGKRFSDFKKAGVFVALFSFLYPLFFSPIAIFIAYMAGLNIGDALLFTVLVSSASYIAVPAAMRMSVPKANMSLLLPMTLGVTFTFNVTLGIPLYYAIIQKIWS